MKLVDYNPAHTTTDFYASLSLFTGLCCIFDIIFECIIKGSEELWIDGCFIQK